MATRTPQPAQQPPRLSVPEMKLGVTKLQRRVADLETFDSNSVMNRWNSEAEPLEKAILQTLSDVFGNDTTDYNHFSDAARLDNGPMIMGQTASLDQVRRYFTEGKERSLRLLRQAIRGLEERIEDAVLHAEESAASLSPKNSTPTNKIFIVHGRDNEVKNEVARFLEKIGLHVIILHERPNLGRHLLTKFEQEAGDVGFAVVLITPDDEGGLAGDENRRPRARQNVIFELGFFIGKLGSSRVVPLVKGNVETPSDFDGVGYVPLDQSGAWKGVLARELKAAQVPFDAEKVFEA
ncbi:hypothetical protein CN187_23770 [Sinorhizobium meliloti]|uniref:TIR domain-containing protein n=1 Tax=Rhizobium meliloti TaxID=382 RepID=UPI000FDAEA49|nr:nucleotide-binding protein [Sinorhizobium meliloti]RVI63893.1 hypothetical protein CN187_23770 [Sinorhizobium meliloti]